MAGSVIAGVLMASPAAAGAATPVPPNTTNSAAGAETGVKELSALDLRQDQRIVRAVVREDGTLVAGQSFGAESATRVENPVGTYQVCFKVPITNGTYVATIGLPGNVSTSAPGEITVVGRIGTSNCLYVQTFDSAGTPADRSFHVAVVYSKKR